MPNVFSVSLDDKDFNALNVASKEQGVSRTAYVADAVRAKLMHTDLQAYYATEKPVKKTRAKNQENTRIISVYLPRENFARLTAISNSSNNGMNKLINQCIDYSLNAASNTGNEQEVIDFIAQQYAGMLHPDLIKKVSGYAQAKFVLTAPTGSHAPQVETPWQPEPAPQWQPAPASETPAPWWQANNVDTEFDIRDSEDDASDSAYRDEG